MEEDEGEPNKILRTTPASLIVKQREDEETYRRKYLPDPTKLPDEKLVCTVCSKSLAEDVHGGKDIFVHKSLLVLVCKECFLFYGSGCFSTDEDGDDKYCRWCGQGGTLFLCSACSCGFCNKCAEKNLKPSAMEEVKQDDWKCLICVPRPIYGLRAIFWAARHLNNIGKEKEKEKLRVRTEKLKILSEIKRSSPKKRKSPATAKYRNGKDELITAKRKYDDEESDSSTVSIPYKKHKNQTANDKSLNGSLKQSHNSSSDLTSDDEISKSKQLSSKKRKKKKKKYETSSSEEAAIKHHKHKKKKEAKYTSESSTDEERKSPNHKHHVKRKRKKQTDTTSSSDDTVERRRNKKKQKDTSDNSTDSEIFTKKDKVISKTVHNKKHKRKEQSKHEEELSSNSDSSGRGEKKDKIEKSSKSIVPDEENKVDEKKKEQESINCSEVSDIVNDVKPNDEDSDATLLDNSQVQVVEKTELTDGSNLNGPGTEVSQPEDSKEYDLTAVPLESTEETPPGTTDIDPKENKEQTIKAAITWLCGVVGDISEIGSLVAKRADSLFEKKMNIDSFQSYDDVLLTLDKIKQFMDGIHQNYNQVESNIDAQFSSWKVAAGLEEIDSEKRPEEVPGIETSEQNKDENSNNAVQESNDVDESNDQNNVQPSLDDKITDNVEKTPEEESVSEALLVGEETKIEVPVTEIEDGVDINSKEDNIGDKLEELGSALTNRDELDNEATIPAPDLEDSIKEDIVGNENEDAINKTEMPPEDETNKESGIDDGIRSVEESKEDDGKTMENKEQPETEVNTLNNAPHIAIPNNLEESVKENEDCLDVPNEDGSPSKLDSKSNEALQELLYSSSDDEINQSDSDSDESGEIELDDSDLEIKKPKKNLVKKSAAVKKTENITTDKNEPEKCTVRKDNTIKIEDNIKKEQSLKKEDIQIKEENGLDEDEIVDINDKVEDENERETTNDEEVEEESQKKESIKSDEELDSEAEIDMLTDLTKLKKKMPSRKLLSKNSSEDEDDSNSEESESEDNDDGRKSSKKTEKVQKRK